MGNDTFPNSRSKVQSLTTSSKQPLSFTRDRAAELTFKCYSKVNVKTHKNITERKEKKETALQNPLQQSSPGYQSQALMRMQVISNLWLSQKGDKLNCIM